MRDVINRKQFWKQSSGELENSSWSLPESPIKSVRMTVNWSHELTVWQRQFKYVAVNTDSPDWWLGYLQKKTAQHKANRMLYTNSTCSIPLLTVLKGNSTYFKHPYYLHSHSATQTQIWSVFCTPGEALSAQTGDLKDTCRMYEEGPCQVALWER